MSSAREIAIGIPLNLWQDPQGDVVLYYSREEGLMYSAVGLKLVYLQTIAAMTDDLGRKAMPLLAGGEF
jgi:tryptophan synthase beta subunit